MKKEDLIVGRWYELQHREKWLFKLSNHQSLELLPTSKCCTPHDGYKSNNAGHLGIEYRNKIKYADMEEVYKFFPEERPIETTYELW
jgi:hypothetical protein